VLTLMAIVLLTVGPPTSPCVVSGVVDGDTFHCRGGPKVRLIGIDAPERDQGAIGREAADALERWLPPGQVVKLERDVEGSDRYGRTLAYVWVADTLVNEAMVRDGWAVLYTVPPNVAHVERLVAAEHAARQSRRGLWASNGFACRPSAFRRKACR
jgi:micrococcal nuclease